MVQEELQYTNVSIYKALTVMNICLVEKNNLCNYDCGHNGKHLCEVILNLVQYVGGDFIF